MVQKPKQKPAAEPPKWMDRNQRREWEQQQRETPERLAAEELDRQRRYGNPPVGMWGLTFDRFEDSDRKLVIQNQFYVLGRVPGTDYFLVRFYSWVNGEESDDSLRPLSWFVDGRAEFFDTPSQMRYRTSLLQPFMDMLAKQELDERMREARKQGEEADQPDEVSEVGDGKKVQ